MLLFWNIGKHFKWGNTQLEYSSRSCSQSFCTDRERLTYDDFFICLLRTDRLKLEIYESLCKLPLTLCIVYNRITHNYVQQFKWSFLGKTWCWNYQPAPTPLHPVEDGMEPLIKKSTMAVLRWWYLLQKHLKQFSYKWIGQFFFDGGALSCCWWDRGMVSTTRFSNKDIYGPGWYIPCKCYDC